MLIIGVDPGVSGAIAVLAPDGTASVYDVPTVEVKVGKEMRRRIDEPAIGRMLRPPVGRWPEETLATAVMCVERSQPMHEPTDRRRGPNGEGPRMSSQANFRLGESFGIWKGAAAGVGIPCDTVPPQTWKAALLAGTAKDKAASLEAARELFPALAATHLTRTKDHGRAEALLIAEWKRRQIDF